jgi:hypothetical protein
MEWSSRIAQETADPPPQLRKMIFFVKFMGDAFTGQFLDQVFQK